MVGRRRKAAILFRAYYWWSDNAPFVEDVRTVKEKVDTNLRERDSMMRDVIIVTGSMMRGGAEGVIATVANGLAQRGWNVHIIAILVDACDYDLVPSVEYINISKEKNNQILDTPRLVLMLRKIVKRIQPEAVFSFMVTINIVTWIATRGLKAKFIPSERNDPGKGRNMVVKRLQSIAYAAADTTVFQTTRAKEFFSQRIQKRSVVIPNPLREMPEAVYRQTNRIVTVGRLTNQKNQKLLIEAFETIHKEYPDFLVDIYGEGSMKEELQQLIDVKGLSCLVHLCGKVENVPECIRDAYMFILPSDYEGLSNALLEAMGIGLPCISTNCAGADDAIQDGINGLIVPTGNRTAMESAMRQLIENPEKTIEMGKMARSSMKRYNVERVVNQWESLLL